MLFDFILKQTKPNLAENVLIVRGRQVPLAMIRNHRARRYLLKLCPDGSVRLTIPRRGSIIEGRRFAERNTDWLARQLEKLSANPVKPRQWLIGTEIFFRGELVRIEPDADGSIRFSTERLKVPDAQSDLRPAIQNHLRDLASEELPSRVLELAALHGVNVSRVSVRNQKSRWGSCSRRGTISLNWRLIQSPGFVRDYIILHELAHRRQMNHSEKFWQEVKHLFPDYLQAERWLKQHSNLLR
jgi:predicted metal-dependent hydrolase